MKGQKWTAQRPGAVGVGRQAVREGNYDHASAWNSRADVIRAYREEQRQTVETELTSAVTPDEVANTLGILRSRVLQLMAMGELPLARVAGKLIGGPEVVDPGVVIGPRGLHALRGVPEGIFDTSIFRLNKTGLGELERAGILQRTMRFRRPVHQLTELGRWVASCLNIPPAAWWDDWDDGKLLPPPSGRLRSLREYVLALAEAAGPTGITAYLVNMAAGNRDLPERNRLELVVVALARHGYLRKIGVDGRRITYTMTPLGAEWLSASRVRVEGLPVLAARLNIRPRIARGTGLPDGLDPVTIVKDEDRTSPIGFFGASGR